MRNNLKDRANHAFLKVLQLPEPNTTRIYFDNLPEAEETLFKIALDMRDRMQQDSDYEPSANERIIVDKFMEVVSLRFIDAFQEWFTATYCKNDPIAQYMFLAWLSWFLKEAIQGVTQFLGEQAIYDQKGKTWKQKEKEADEYCRENWKSIFTRESFEKHIRR